jgi:hypothetical protein
MPKTKLKSKEILTDNLVDIKEAPDRFGRGWSVRSVYRRIENGELSEGVHFIDDASPASKKRIIKLIISAIQELRGIARHQR